MAGYKASGLVTITAIMVSGARFFLAGILTILAISRAQASDKSYSPAVDQDFPMSVYWGDTHLHTNLSVDANGMGNKLLTPEDAYRFAKGETVTAHNRQKVRLRRPLDFLVVADHAVNIGVMPRVAVGDPLIMKTRVGKLWSRLQKENPMHTGDILNSKTAEPRQRALAGMAPRGGQPSSFFWSAWATNYVSDVPFRRSVWQEICANAERHNAPGKFTAFIGFEWTPAGGHPRSPNLHRNIIFKDGPNLAGKVLPFSIQDSDNVEDLWAYLNKYKDKIGGDVLAIAHNGNLSRGVMFGPNNYDGNPIDLDYARMRASLEPLYEATQIKGDSEAHPILSPNDEFADFETWHVSGFYGERPPNWEEQKKTEYVRSALKLGLEYQSRLGVNPFKIGLIGSTDAHTSLATGDEDNFWGKLSLNEPSPYRLANAWHFNAAGYAAVWALENTRASLFEAMMRKETYATTGPRMVLRFFGGWNFEASDSSRPDLARIGYSKGVPMGGDLAKGRKGKAPSFLIRAVKDPDGANLDRVQVIKGWRDKGGELHEAVYNVAVSDGRKIGKKGKVKPVGSTVDVADASYTNSIGDPELAVVWTDPDFDENELSFYYVRVLQIPTPRWTAYDAKYYGLKNIPDNVPMVTQDRAYSSPIWFTPPGR